MARPLEQLEGKYEILEKIQEGGMGAIYTVRHLLLGEVRVVKVIRPHLQDEITLRSRFLQEARAAARLAHPGIARVFDFTVDEDENAYLVMEYIRGITLGELIRAGERPPLGLALELARQSLSALGYIHRQHIVHRDVAPDNLMLSVDDTGTPQVKLIDLGLAKMVEGVTGGLTSSGIFLGKFRYAAPEQFDDTRAGGETTSPTTAYTCDLYSFALVLYELLTGTYPIQGETATSLIAGHLFRPPIPFEASDPEGCVPEKVRRAIMKALAKSPEERQQSAAELAEDLEIEVDSGLETPAGRRILELARNPPRPSTYRPGSTQVELDQQFAPVPTPLPTPPAPAAGAPAAGTTAIPLPSRPPPEAFDPERSTVVMPPIPGQPPRETDAPAAGAPAADTDDLLARARNLAEKEDLDAASQVLQQVLAIREDSTARRLLSSVETCRRIRRRETAKIQLASPLPPADAPGPTDRTMVAPMPGTPIPTPSPQPAAKEGSEEISSELPTQRLPLETLSPPPPGIEAPELPTPSAPTAVAPSPAPDAFPGSTDPTVASPWSSLDEALLELSQMVDSGRESAALGKLHEALQIFGAHPGLLEIRSRLGTALLDRDAEVRQAEDPFGTVTTLDTGMVEPRAGSPASAMDGQLLANTVAPPPPARRPGSPTGLQGASPRSPAGLAELTLDGRQEELVDQSVHLELRSSGASPAGDGSGFEATVPRRTVLPDRSERPGSQDFRRFGIVGLLAVAILAVFGWWLGRPTPENDESTLPVEDVQAARLTPGIVLLDAQPWGEIVELEDQHGERPPFSGPRSTPRLLSLPPGTYRLVLRHPPSDTRQEIQFEVVSGERLEIRRVLRAVDADQYFETMGW